MSEIMDYERPPEPHSEDDYPDQWQRVLEWEIVRGDRLETENQKLKEQLDNLKVQAVEIQEGWVSIPKVEWESIIKDNGGK